MEHILSKFDSSNTVTKPSSVVVSAIVKKLEPERRNEQKAMVVTKNKEFSFLEQSHHFQFFTSLNPNLSSFMADYQKTQGAATVRCEELMYPYYNHFFEATGKTFGTVIPNHSASRKENEIHPDYVVFKNNKRISMIEIKHGIINTGQAFCAGFKNLAGLLDNPLKAIYYAHEAQTINDPSQTSVVT